MFELGDEDMVYYVSIGDFDYNYEFQDSEITLGMAWWAIILIAIASTIIAAGIVGATIFFVRRKLIRPSPGQYSEINDIN